MRFHLRCGLVLLAACGTPPTTNEVPVQTAEEEAPSNPPPDVIAPPPILTDAPAWRWVGPEPGGRFAPVSLERSGLRCSVSEVSEHRFELRCDRGRELVWSHTYDDFVGAAVLASNGEDLFVARYSRIATGCTIFAYTLESGAERWRRALYGIGPVGHSEYSNAVELEVEGDRVTAYGWESGGRYIETLSFTGQVRGNWQLGEGGVWNANEVAAGDPTIESAEPARGVAASLTSFDWQGPELSSIGLQRSLELPRPGGGVCRFRSNDARTLFECTDAAGARLFGSDLPHAFHAGASMAIEGTTLIVARFHPIASGCEVAAYDLASPRELWRKYIYGAGPIDHSRYRNEVHVRFVDGQLRVYGWETALRYIQVLDPANGQTIGWRAFDRP